MKAKVVTSIRPQLAHRGTWEDKIGDPLWVGEEKFDGTRYLAAVTRTGVRVISRRGVEKTDRLPELVAELQRAQAAGILPIGSILDGEIVAGTFSETISLVNSLGTRGVHASTPHSYMVFDILREGGQELYGLTLRSRRHRLTRIFESLQGGIAKLTPQFSSTELESLLEGIWARGGEGIIVKHLDGRYEQGKRSRSWIKVKAVQTADGVILGFTDGEGKYSNTIGAIIVGQYKAGKLTRVCKMSGMSDEVRYRLGDDRDSFNGSVVEFAYQNRTDDSYRHPRFKRFRPDKAPDECIWEDT